MALSKHVVIALYYLALTLSAPTIVVAEDNGVFTWTDAKGVIHYSAGAAVPDNAQPAKLPELGQARGSIRSSKGLQTCSKHGGIDCQQGPDADGSVICYDGYREAASRFRFHCLETKLKIVDQFRKADEIHVLVRNTKSITAQDPQVTVNIRGTKLMLSGGREISPYAVEEFSAKHNLGSTKWTPKLADIKVTCLNCNQ